MINLNPKTPQEAIILLAIVWFGASFVITPLTIYGLMQLDWVKQKIFWLKKKKSARIGIITEDDSIYIDRYEIVLKGTREFAVLPNSKELYAYQPIAYDLGLVQKGNAIPYITGGYIEQKMVDKAKDTLKLKSTSETLMNPSDEKQEQETQRVYSWVMSELPKELKKVVIRPFVKWSSQELYDAIHSKIVEDILSTQPTTLDFILAIGILLAIIVTAYFGYTNQQTITTLQNELAKLRTGIINP